MSKESTLTRVQDDIARGDLGKATPPDRGVFYEIHDYAGILRRLSIVVVDFVVLLLIGLFLAVAETFSDFLYQHGERVLMLYLAVCYLYLAALKATRWGTIGYLITGVRLVNLRGKQASIWRATYRFLFIVAGPLNVVFDIICWVEMQIDRAFATSSREHM